MNHTQIIANMAATALAVLGCDEDNEPHRPHLDHLGALMRQIAQNGDTDRDALLDEAMRRTAALDRAVPAHIRRDYTDIVHRVIDALWNPPAEPPRYHVLDVLWGQNAAIAA